MDPVKYVILGIGIIYFIGRAWPFVLSFINSKKEDIKQKEVKVKVEDILPPETKKAPAIHEVVEQWDKLRQMCTDLNLKDSVKNLDQVFLTLLKKDIDNGKL